MDQRRRFHPHLGPGRLSRNASSARPEDLPSTTNTHAGPGMESLPPYSPAAYVSPTPTEPPPAYQPSSTPLPNYSAPTESPPAPEIPAPVIPVPQPAPDRTFTSAQQYRALKDIFTRHPWRRRAWGHQPTSFAAVLNTAALYGQEQYINELFALGVRFRGNRDCALPTTTPMHEALRGPKPGLAIYLLDQHYLCGGQADELLESKDSNGCTPLHIAAQAGETAIARSFIEVHGAMVDAMDDIGRTPLHMAALYSRTETIDMLLECGADPSLVSQRLWNFDKLGLREGEVARRRGLLGSFTFISKTLRGALERANRGHELALSDDAGTSAYQLHGAAEQENADPDVASTKPVVASTFAASQPRSLVNEVAGSSTQAPCHDWGIDALVGELRRVSLGHGTEDADAAAHRNRRARVRAAYASTGLFSPEYVRWKESLDVLYQESRVQKERNRREEEAALGLPRQ
ncbi:ankyrin repeat-containing domain protein [Podospora conica]|nr:ankyrin repeat-containing domain protein [Schizothecium conicum]